MKVGVAILAAGSGTRFGTDKTLLELGNKPVWRWSVDTFSAVKGVSEIVIVTGANHDQIQSNTDCRLVRGRGERQDSARVGVEALYKGNEVILVHDAARPFVDVETIERVIDACRLSGASAPAIPVIDTIRDQSGTGRTVIERSRLMAMQTPQGGTCESFQKAYAFLDTQPEILVTDEMALFEASGIEWVPVTGSALNSKITNPADAMLANGLLRHEVRSGIGYDIHRFAKGQNRELYLGGILFKNEPGLEGHSDADVIIHAAVDALLGAVSLGDIGVHFPPSDPQWKNRRSTEFLVHAKNLVARSGWTLVNLDIAVIAETPRVMPRAQEIKECLAGCLQMELSRVSIKATTNEGLGSLGRKEGIAAYAVAALEQYRLPNEIHSKRENLG